MKKELSTWEAANILFNDENAGWSRSGAFALVEHLEELESDIGETIEFCSVGIRCDYTEYKSLDEVAEYYPDSLDGMRDKSGPRWERREESIREYILDRGQLIEFDGGVIISSF